MKAKIRFSSSLRLTLWAAVMMLVALPAAAQPQGIKINGMVVDSKGEPIPGVTVLIKGTTVAAATDIDGNYFITAPDRNALLVFSFIGYKQQEIRVGRQININVTMLEEAYTLEEVTVSAYGEQRRISVVGAISTIEPAKLQSGVSRSVSNNLAGQLAGVIGVQRTGEPGRDNSDIWIRGMNTFQGFTSPLILVDGVERSMNDMDPAEIESFSILKDASATAMYGVRGANGVILINTKRGVIGKPRVSLRTEYAVSMPTQLPEFVDAVKYMQVMNSIVAENGGSNLPYSEERILKTQYGYDPELYPNTNWLDVITKDFATTSRTNLTVSGGTEILRYALVGSYYNEQGIMVRDPNQDWDSGIHVNRYNLRSNVDVNVTKTTLLRINVGGFLQDENRPPVGAYSSVSDLIGAAFLSPPTLPVVYNDGKIPIDRENPWMNVTQRGYERNTKSKIESLFSVEQNLRMVLPGLKAKVSFSFDNYSNASVKREKTPDRYNIATGRTDEGELITTLRESGQEFLGHGVESGFGNKTVYFEGLLAYTNTLFDIHYLDFMLLANRRQYDDGSKLPFRNQGLAGRFSYNFTHRYIAEFNFGYNGSENLSKENRYGFFPSFAVGWILSEEKFMTPLKDIFNQVKFKLSYGLVGNDQMAGRRFAYLPTIERTKNWAGNDTGYGWGVDPSGMIWRDGRQEGDAGVPELKWETVAKTNIGLDLRMFNSLNIQIDLFKEHRTDILMQRTTAAPEESGFIKAIWANHGIVDNRGIDLTVEYTKRINDDWDIALRGTLTYAKNEIVEKDEPSTIIGTWRSETGHAIGTLNGLVAERLYTEDDFADVANSILKSGLPTPTYESRIRPGDIKYTDLSGDGIINDFDKGPIGDKTVDPKLVYGIGLSVGYKSFDLSVFFQGTGNMYRMIGNGNEYFLPGTGVGSIGNLLSNVDDRWTTGNPRQDVTYPRLNWGLNSHNRQPSTWWVRNMSFLRLKNIELGYNFPRELVSAIGIQGLRLFLSGTNLLTFSEFDLWDPEIGSDHGSVYPTMKSVQLGLNVNF
jgi:TonB-linked SusC/RagA family outer membrane protein